MAAFEIITVGLKSRRIGRVDVDTCVIDCICHFLLTEAVYGKCCTIHYAMQIIPEGGNRF